MKAAPMLKAIEVLIISPPVQQVVSLKVGSVHKVTEVSIPLLPIQHIMALKAGTPFKVAEVQIPTVPIQQVTPLRIASPTKIITSPVFLHLKPISDLSFFWNSEAEEMSKAAPEFSFFWDPEAKEKNEVTSNSTSEVEKFTASVPNQVIITKVPSAPVQNVSIVRASTSIPINMHKIPSAPIQSLTTLLAVPVNKIIETSITSPPPTKLIYCTFTLKKSAQLPCTDTERTGMIRKQRSFIFIKPKRRRRIHMNRLHQAGVGSHNWLIIAQYMYIVL